MKIKHTIQIAIALSALVAITGCGDASTSQGETALSPAKNAPEASGTSSFDKVTAKLDKGGDLFLYYNTEDVIRSLDNFVTTLVPITRQTLLQNLNEPLTEQEQNLVGRWKESSDAENEGSMEIIYRKDRTYSYLVKFQPDPSFNDGNEPKEEILSTGHGIWQIIDDQMHAADMVWDDNKTPPNAPLYPSKVVSLSKTAFNIELQFDDTTINRTGEVIESFEGPEMADYNKEEALSEFDIIEAYNKAKDFEGEIDFGPNHQLNQPLNLVANISHALLDQAGIGNIKGIGMSSTKPQADLFRNKMFIHLYEAKASGKLWSILGSEPHEFEMLKLLPVDTALAFSHEIHPQALLDWIPSLLEAGGAPPQIKGQFEQLLQMANAQFGLDGLLASFDNEIGVFATLDDSKKLQLPPPLSEVPMPGFAIVAKVKDDKLIDFALDALQQASGPQMEKRTVAGVEMLVITEPAPLPVPLAPSFFRLGDFFVIANTEALAKRIVATHNGDEKNLTTTDEFQRLAKELNLKGNHLFFAGEKVEAMGKIMTPAIKQLLQEAPIPQNSLNLDWEDAFNIQTLGVIRMEKDGIMVENQSRKGIVNSVVMQTGMLPVMIGTGMLVPELAKAKARAQRISCVNNLKQIGIATRIYATDKQDRFPWHVPQAESGTAEVAKPKSDTTALLDADGKPIFDANAWLHFQALSNELSNPKVLRCPTDGSRTLANTFASKKPQDAAGSSIIPFDENSVSYWLRTDPEVEESRPNEVMVVCPHHDGQFNVLLTDSSVQQSSWGKLTQYFIDIKNPITLPRFPR